MNSSNLPKLSEKTTLVTVSPTSPVQSNQILLIKSTEGQPMSGILLPSNHFMLKLNQNTLRSELDSDDYNERESTSKYFSMNKSEKKMFRETFFYTLLDCMHQIVKDGRIASSSDPIWECVASKLDNILKPKSIYNRFILNKHSCRTRLIEAYLKDPKSQTTDTTVLNNMMKTNMRHEVVEKRPGHVDNETFYEALFKFKDKVLKNGEVAPSVDSVWNQISAHLNYALKPNSIYLRFKRNTHNCQKKLLTHCKLDPSKAKTYDVSNRKVISPSVEKPINKIKKKNLKFEDTSRFFKALYAHRHMIIQNGSIAKNNNSVWNEIAKMLDYALQPSDIHSKFIRNHDLCQTKLIEACKEDENFTQWVVPKFYKPNSVPDEAFFSVLCKYRDDILQNDNEIAKFSHPVWTKISRDLNNTLKPATIYFRVTRNSQLCLNRLRKSAELKSYTCKDTVDKEKFFETICLYKYSIMNGDQVVELNDPVWNEISLQLNSSLTPEAVYDTISQDKDLCKTKMIQALKTERSVFSGENLEISENMDELTPIVECNVYNELTKDFNEILNEYKDSILQGNGQIAFKDNPIWNQIALRLKDLRSDEVYSRIVNNYKNCRTKLFGVDSVNKNKLFEAIFAYRRLVLNNKNVIANINNEVWTKISEKINYSLTSKEIYIRFIKDVDECRTKLLKFLKLPKKHLTRSPCIDKDTFLDLMINHKNDILKNGSHAKPSDPVWKEMASKLNYITKPLTFYNHFISNRHNCQQKLLEACKLNKETLPLSMSSKITSQMDHDYIKSEVDTNFEDLVSMRQKVGYVQENDFIDACLVFKNRLIKHDSIVSSTDKVWDDISKYLNYAIKSKTAYLRFKRNTHNCQEKLFQNVQLNELPYEGDGDLLSIEDQSIENEMFFDAISIFKHSIINNGIFATESSPVWLDVSNLMNNLLSPDEAFWKFRQNVDSCRTKLINKCISDWSNESSLVIHERIQAIKSKEVLWKETLKSEQIAKINKNNKTKPISINDNRFCDAIYKYKNDIFSNNLIPNISSPVWVAIAKELNNELEPSTIYYKLKNNMTKYNLKFIEAFQKFNQNKNQLKKEQLINDESSNDSYKHNMEIDYDEEEIIKIDAGKLKYDISNMAITQQL